jgi:hypothetical protein
MLERHVGKTFLTVCVVILSGGTGVVWGASSTDATEAGAAAINREN